MITRGRTASRIICSDPLAHEYLRFQDRWLSRAHRDGRVEIDSNPIEEIPFLPDSFDTVVLINVLDHVRDVALCLDNALKLLRPNGWLVLGQDLAKPETVGDPRYEWFEQGHPHRVVMTNLEPYLSRLDRRYQRIGPPRDPRLQTSVLAWAGVKRGDRG
ncbi:MAG: class I SAM-dependent methyltransferase [Gaiellaceae bacterium]